MDRGNTKPGPRLDEQMATEAQGLTQGGGDSRVEEWHHPEPAGEDQPESARVTGDSRAGAPAGMTYAEVEERSRLGRFIPMAALPGDRDALIDGARQLNAPDDIVAMLGRLPEGQVYQTVSQIWAALGHSNEIHRT